MLYGQLYHKRGRVINDGAIRLKSGLFLRCAAPHRTIRSPRGLPACGEVFGDFLYGCSPHTKYCVPFSACMTCPVRGVKVSLSLFAIQCPPYSVFKVQCRTGAAKISAYIYHLSFTVCRCCRFSSASISGGIRSTSRCKLSSSLFSFARSIVSFIFAFFTGLCPCFQLLILRQQVIDCDLVLFQLPGEVLHLGEALFSAWRGLPLFSFRRSGGLMPSRAASMAFRLSGEGNRLFEKPGGGYTSVLSCWRFPPRSKSGYFSHHIGVKIVLPLRQVCPVADNLLCAHRRLSFVSGTKVKCRWGVFSSMCTTADTYIFPSYPANEEICRPFGRTPVSPLGISP